MSCCSISEKDDKFYVKNLLTKVDSLSAPALEKDLLPVIEAVEKDVLIDMSNLDYISSSGLRVLLKLAKSKERTIKLYNVKDAVFDILAVTGFLSFFNVHRIPREYSIDGLTKIGQGGIGAIYRIDEERIIKVFNKDVPFESVFLENESAKRAVLAGLPANISFEAARVGDSFAAVYELLDGDTLLEMFHNNPDQEDEILNEYVDFLKHIHSIKFKDSGAENMLARYHRELEAGRSMEKCTEEEYLCMNEMLNRLPDGDRFIHGDLHFKNVMKRNNEMMLIDLPDSGYGHPVNDIIALCRDYKLPAEPMFMELLPEGMIEAILGFKAEKCLEIWKKILTRYYSDKTPEEIEEIDAVITSFAYLRNSLTAMVLDGIATPELRQKEINRAINDYKNTIKNINLSDIL